MRLALTRAVPDAIVRCELTHLERSPIDVRQASAQHAEYESLLRTVGCRVERLPGAPELPDSVFVEDTAVVFDEVAVVTRPGAESRRAEVASMHAALARYRPVHSIVAPGTMDGGDVLVSGRTIYVGISSRTNEQAARQLADIVRPYGYAVECTAVRGCLHLKSAVTAIEDDLVLCNPQWVDPGVFHAAHRMSVDPDEPFAANVLRVNGSILCAAAHPRTAALLAGRGCDVRTVDVSELAKAEAGVTCCSVILTTEEP